MFNMQKITTVLANLPGWFTKRKLVVIESDDWGSIRMPSAEVYRKLLKEGHKVDNLSFNRYDSLASETDISALYDVLLSFKDATGRHPVITANTIVANPDFNLIKKTDYQEYHFELFTETLKNYPEHKNVFSLWQEGIKTGIFKPQFHGREHLNVNRWMKALQNNTGKVRLAFDNKMYDLSEDTSISENTFVDAFNFQNHSELEFYSQSITEGLDIFEQIFGYRSETMIAPCYIWSKELEETMFNSGIKGIQGGYYQFEPSGKNLEKLNKTFNYLGKRNKFNQAYLVRNVLFEPSSRPDYNWVENSLNRIDFLFSIRKPVIISVHRLNFVGYINKENRVTNLKLFREFLGEIIRRHPNAEFITSDELVNLMNY